MNPTPEVSVIIPSYRGAERLPALLDSLAQQEDQAPSFEVIVVIDGVDDGSVAILDDESRLDVRPVLFPENQGRVAALNAGFEAAQGNVLIRCDDDLVVPPGYIAAHVQAHADGAVVGAVGPTRDVHAPSPYARAYGEDSAERSYEYALSRPEKERWRLWAASCSITRATWHRIGPYDALYRGYGWEDVDYGYRLHTAGLPIRLVERATAAHHGPARSVRARALKAFDAGTARVTFTRRHPGAPVPEPSAGPGLWGLGVEMTARATASASAAARFSGLVDRALPVLPRSVGRKLAALAVEGAGLAGSRSALRTKGLTS